MNKKTRPGVSPAGEPLVVKEGAFNKVIEASGATHLLHTEQNRRNRRRTEKAQKDIFKHELKKKGITLDQFLANMKKQAGELSGNAEPVDEEKLADDIQKALDEDAPPPPYRGRESKHIGAAPAIASAIISGALKDVEAK